MLSIVYITFRENCKFEWFISSLIRQSDESLRKQIQIIIVDGILNENEMDRRTFISEIIGDSFEFAHVPPKPTIWQGKYRLTKEDYFAAANTRNTGACYAKYDFIAFHDDLGCPSQTWLNAVLKARELGQVHCGAYTKAYDIVVEDGVVIDKRDNGIDNRLSIYSENISAAHSSHFYGSSFCMPLELYFKLNGMNEMCDGNAGEDCEFGIRILRNGTRFYYNKLMFIYESENIFGSDKNRKCVRSDPKKDPNNPHSDMCHYMLDYVNKCDIYSINPEFSLKDYNDKILKQKLDHEQVFLKPVDKIHFFTGKLISEGLDSVASFHWQNYIAKYPDLQKAGINTEEKALSHYNTFGKKENRTCY